jgi:hypothetical protein
MYGLSSSEANNIELSDEEASNGTTAEAPLEYTPTGWYRYKVMGPCAEKQCQSHLLDVRD